MAKHSKFAMGAIIMKIVILSCPLGGNLFRHENAPPNLFFFWDRRINVMFCFAI